MSRNELGDGIAVDTDWFRMFAAAIEHCIRKKYKLRLCGGCDVCDIGCDWKSGTMGEGPGARRV